MRGRATGLILAVGTAVLGAACHGSDASATAPSRSCGVVVWHRPASTAAVVEIVGDFNGWSRPGRILPADRDDGWRVTELDFPAGEHTYAIVEDGVWLTDPNVPTTAFRDGHEVSWIDVASCDVPALQVTNASGAGDGTATIAARLLASRAGDPLDPATITATTRDGRAFSVRRADPASGTIELAASGLPPGKHTVTIQAKDTRGRPADEAGATAWIEPRPGDPSDWVIYQVIVDRYRGPGGALAAPSVPSDWAGGTL